MRRAPLPLAVLAGLAWLVACDSYARPALPTAPSGARSAALVASRQAAPAGPFLVPFSGRATNPCTGEGFSFDGTLRLLLQQQSNGNWDLFVGQANGSAEGTGDAGTRYVIRLHRTENNHFVFDSPAGQATTVETYQVRSSGGGENFRMHAVLRLLLNPDFSSSVLVNRLTTICTG